MGKCASCRITWINESVKVFLQKQMFVFVPQTQVNVLLSFFRLGEGTTSCPLVAKTHSYSCVCRVTSFFFSLFSSYNIQLCNETGCNNVKEHFEPSQNSKYNLYVIHTDCMCLSDLHVCLCLFFFACTYVHVSRWYYIFKITLKLGNDFAKCTVYIRNFNLCKYDLINVCDQFSWHPHMKLRSNNHQRPLTSLGKVGMNNIIPSILSLSTNSYFKHLKALRTK